MTIYNFYLFNKDGCCVSYKEWKREKEAVMSKDEVVYLKFYFFI